MSVISGSVAVYDTNLRAQAAITTLPRGIPALVMLDANGEVAYEFLAGGPETPYLRLVDKDGNDGVRGPTP